MIRELSEAEVKQLFEAELGVLVANVECVSEEDIRRLEHISEIKEKNMKK